MGKTIDYSKYKMNEKEIIIGFLIGFAITFLYVNVVLHKAAFAAAVGVAAGLVYLRTYKKKCIEKRNAVIVKQFKDLMESLVSSYSSGGNHVTAFETAYTDMVELYGKDGWISREVEFINTGLKNGMTTEALLRDFAKRVGNEDITNFVDVFIVCIRNGGDMKRVLYDTRLTIMDKLEMEEEISVQLRESYNEFMILTVIPVVIDFFMQADTAMSATGQTTVGVISRFIAVALCVISYRLGRGIIHRVEKVFE